MPDIMGKMDIAFPNLNIYLENVPKSFSIFGFTIALYGVIIGFGFFLALILITNVAKRTGQNPDTYWDVATYVIVFSIIGARLYYVFFAWDYYKDDPISILNIRNGGLAIYGGVIAGFLTAAIYCKIKKTSFLKMADTCMYGLLLGQTMGRWGNFTNREAFGEYTNGPFAMRLPVEMVRSGEITELMKEHMSAATNYVQVSPTFLYESMWNLGLLILLLLYLKHKKFDGEIMLMYLGGYGLGRAWIEGLRTDQLIMHTTGLPVSQMLAICLVIFAVVAEVVVRVRLKKAGTKEAAEKESSEENTEE
ncbi:phosphatidylglycerol:prolipoprotein diacylglycerol transferase [Butyrivibrio hungatei DSM 14810]|uniref:Phosphatidylglycerol--prolipoprotein diacylglyceryl transferase n=1 Tax=Butyrivibrio hungatei DSM 14810 TaxID=1121132 RepID=A0A1M7S9S9_9FIRM|nr:prolipoprotein diacylglyceryl transferase [Butyrivibrio hungatei]SHN55178.1 phosphatidylglycerol:prolipoprotein diacylglycerol transferase [Butyrivibrio hungatei DSM 14810]